MRTARLAREAGLSNWIKLEVIGDERTLFPDNEALLEATRALVHGRLRRAALHERRPDRLPQARGRRRGGRHAARRADRLGPRHPESRTTSASSGSTRACPVIVDAGVGTASDAAIAMELGADGVLMNTAIAGAANPAQMAAAMKHAVDAGRLAFLAGRIPRRAYATASSPVDGLIAAQTAKR